MEITTRLTDLYQKSQFKEGLLLIRHLTRQNTLHTKDIFQVKLMEIKFLEKLEKREQGLQLIEDLLQDPQIIADQLNKLAIMIEKAKILFSKQRLDLVHEIVKSIESQLIIDENFEDPNVQKIAADLSILRGGCYWQNGELDNALYSFRLNFKIRKKLQNPLDLAHALNNMGVMYNATGDFLKATQYLQDALENYEKIQYKRGISKTGNNLGAIYLQLGELDKSEEIIRKSLEIDVNDNYNDGIIVACQNLGEIFWHKKNYHQATYYMQQSLKYCEQKQSLLQISEVLVPYIMVDIATENLSRAKRFIQKLSEIQINTDNKLVNQRLLLCNAVLLQASGERQSLIEAERLLTSIVEDKVRYFDVTVMAITNLCEILFNQAEITHNPQFILKIEKYLGNLINLADKSHSYYILAKIFWLNSILLSYRLQFEASQENLIKALHIVVKYNLKQLEEKIFTEFDTFLENWSFWKQSSEKDLKKIQEKADFTF